MTRRSLIFANGDVFDGPMVRRALDAADDALVIAADGGARVAQHYGLAIDRVIGDFDSLSEDEQHALQAAGVEFERHPPEKDFTDLELALRYAIDNGIEWLRVIGGLGDRFDQTMANVYLLALDGLEDRDARIVAGRQEIRLLHPGDYTLVGHQGDTVSLIPIGGAVRGVTTDGLHYSLRGETLEFGPARGISNVLADSTAHISMADGMLLVVHTEGRA
jgi:thiamine pyrophosphokinase